MTASALAPPEPSHAPGPAPLGPDSLVWRLGFPRTGMLVAGRALLMQVAHPVIGAGVRDFSAFRTDPWGRLDRTITSLTTQLFGGQQSITEAQRLREMHRSIKGVGFHGERYSALDPQAYAYVHLSNIDSTLKFNDLFVRPLSTADKRRLFADWRQAGLVLGIKDAHMPTDVEGLRAYIDDKVAHELELNVTCTELIGTLNLRDIPPPYALLPRPMWAALKPSGRHLLHDTTVGTLPPALREKLGLEWSAADEQRLQRVAAAVRAAAMLVPDRALHYPLAYQAVRAAKRTERRRTA